MPPLSPTDAQSTQLPRALWKARGYSAGASGATSHLLAPARLSKTNPCDVHPVLTVHQRVPATRARSVPR